MNKIGEDTLRELYIEKQMAMKEIAEMIGVSVGSVYNYCHKYGIESRKTADVLRGRVVSEETRKKLSKAGKGKKRTEESKKRMSEAKKMGGIGHKKKRSDGYIAVYFPDHPKSNKDGYIMEHILVMECLIGRHLNENEVVHHRNHKRDDNRAENLQLMSKKEHMSLHTAERHRKGEIPVHRVRVINCTTGNIYDSVKEAAKAYGVAPTNISRACRSKKRTVKGCSWKYAE